MAGNNNSKSKIMVVFGIIFVILLIVGLILPFLKL
jgi:uncharacterized membrane protein YbaN (DUF454 family)